MKKAWNFKDRFWSSWASRSGGFGSGPCCELWGNCAPFGLFFCISCWGFILCCMAWGQLLMGVLWATVEQFCASSFLVGAPHASGFRGCLFQLGLSGSGCSLGFHTSCMVCLGFCKAGACPGIGVVSLGIHLHCPDHVYVSLHVRVAHPSSGVMPIVIQSG